MIFHSLWIVDLKLHDVSTSHLELSRSLGHVMFSFMGTAQEVGAGGRSVVDRGQLVSLFTEKRPISEP